ncbi:lung seven transmembrane receptor family protein [Striga asiatica]|uniref:Lung seven transmembrane receptor family protein n=1 Tax=Striga asiatica TaxID=4170 RepID=A0A5A7Q8B5_STRAF|nr:lung seven transmembrane receptor family protein [Striga asiatica]
MTGAGLKKIFAGDRRSEEATPLSYRDGALREIRNCKKITKWMVANVSLVSRELFALGRVTDIPFSFSPVAPQPGLASPRSIQITKTGMYNLYFIHCDPNLKDIYVEGKTVWKNPTVREVLERGSSFAELYYARDYLGMFEMAFWYFDYAEFNETGVRPTGTTLWAVTFGIVKRTVSRLIILIVSMGYGVVRPTLGGLTSKVILLGGTFFVASEILEIIENVGTISDLSGKARLFFALPVAILDAFFILWIFTSLSSTLNKLQSEAGIVSFDRNGKMKIFT